MVCKYHHQEREYCVQVEKRIVCVCMCGVHTTMAMTVAAKLSDGVPTAGAELVGRRAATTKREGASNAPRLLLLVGRQETNSRKRGGIKRPTVGNATAHKSIVCAFTSKAPTHATDSLSVFFSLFLFVPTMCVFTGAH